MFTVVVRSANKTDDGVQAVLPVGIKLEVFAPVSYLVGKN